MDAWSSDDVDIITQFKENITSKIVNQPPLIKVSETLSSAFGDEVSADLEVSDEGRLFMRYLKYTGIATSDITTGYDRMLVSISNLISKTRIELGNGSIIGFEEPTFISDVKHTPLYCRQHGISYVLQINVNAYKAVPQRDESGQLTGFLQKQLNNTGNIEYHNFIIGEIPLMIGSRYCITVRKQMTPTELFEIGECVDDPPGYFIIDGNEYLLMMQDKLRTNMSICTFEKGVYKIKMTCDDYINSTVNVVITKDKNNVYVIPVKFLAADKSYQTVDINVLLIFRTLGYANYAVNNTFNDIFKLIDTYVNTDVREPIKNNIIIILNNLGLNRPNNDTINMILNMVMPYISNEFQDISKNELSSALTKWGYPKDINQTYKDIEATILLFVKPEWRNIVKNELLSTFGNLGYNKDDFETFSNIRKESYNEETRSKYLQKIEGEIFPQYKYEGNSHTTINYLKCYSLGMMIAKLALTATGLIPPDERDSWSLKRLLTAGPKMYQLFNLEWRKFIIFSLEHIRNSGSGGIYTGFIKNILMTVKNKMDIKKTFNDSFKTLWGNEKYNKKEKYTDILKRESKIAPWAYLNRIKKPGSQENKKLEARAAHMTQFGYVDPLDTPEGKDGCGVVQNKAITAWISTGSEEIIILEYLKELMNNNKYFIGFSEGYTILILNGKIMGSCIGQYVYETFIDHRRNGRLPKDIMIVLDVDKNTLYIYTDSGRMTRPLLIVNQKTGDLVIDEKNMWNANINELLSNGCMEYIDSFEHEFSYIAVSIQALRKRKEDIEALENLINELIISHQFFLETGNIKYSVLEKEKKERDKNIKEIKDKLDGLIRSQENDQANLEKILKDFKDIESNIKMGVLSKDELRNKFIDINYPYKKLVVNISSRLKIIKKYAEKKQSLEDISLNDSISSDYFESQLESAKNNLNNLNKKIYTHCELHPGAILGISASLIHSLNKNPAPRGGFQCNMGRAALGIYHSNFQYRFDTTAKLLANPSAPIIEGQITRMLGLERYGHGENIIMAIMSYEFNQEDAVILNKASVERGLFRILVRKSFTITVANIPNKHGDVIKTENKTMTPYEGVDPKIAKDMYRYRHLDINGIAKVESVLNEGDCLVGIQETISRGGMIEKIDKSKFIDKEYDGYVVDTYSVTQRNGEITIKIILRDYRIPIKGDKFASRIAQKSTIGLIIPEEDMPVDDKGMTPDMILNPNAFPSRGTISHLIEMLAGKAAVLSGWNINLATFRDIPIEKFLSILRQHGYNQWGYQHMKNGRTGQYFKAEIYVGPIYYQALKHHVKDKIQARQRGKRDQLTHEAVKGRKKGGGIKMGEMEMHSLVSHGAAGMLNDTHCVSSNAFTCVLCRKCKRMFDIKFNITDTQFKCRICGDESDIVKAVTPYSTVGLSGIINIMTINMELITRLKDKQ